MSDRTEEIRDYLGATTIGNQPDSELNLSEMLTCIKVIGKHPVTEEKWDEVLVFDAAESLLQWLSDCGLRVEIVSSEGQMLLSVGMMPV